MSNLFNLRVKPSPTRQSQFIIVTPAKIVPQAVDRNLLKRRLRAALRPLKAAIPSGWQVMIFVKKEAVMASYRELATELATTLKNV